VHAVVTGAEMPIPFGIIVWTPDEQALATDRVRYIGDAVAAVAAVDEDTANRALELIASSTRCWRPILDPTRPRAAPTCRSTRRRSPAHNGNISKIVKLSFGEVERGLAESDVVVEGEYFFEGTTHTPIEPHCAIGSGRRAAPGRPAHRLVVHAGAALPAPRAGRVLELDPARVRVIQPHVGGGSAARASPSTSSSASPSSR
jgi:4-hydroxybenzoyl-CoA reductase subunit alpha